MFIIYLANRLHLPLFVTNVNVYLLAVGKVGRVKIFLLNFSFYIDSYSQIVHEWDIKSIIKYIWLYETFFDKWLKLNLYSYFPGAANPLVFGITKFGNPIITWGNYRFIKKLARRVKTWWECTARKSSGCRCVAVTVNDRLVKLNGWHNH